MRHIKTICVRGHFTLEIANVEKDRDAGAYSIKINSVTGKTLRAATDVKIQSKKIDEFDAIENEKAFSESMDSKWVKRVEHSESGGKGQEEKSARKVRQLAEEVVQDAMTKAVAVAVAESVIESAVDSVYVTSY